MHTNFALHSARAPGLRLPGIIQLPNRLRQQPLNWQYQAEEFNRFGTNPANSVIYHDPAGHIAFTALHPGTSQQ